MRSTYLLLLVTALSVSSCSLISLPTQGRPECSWTGTPPRNANALCGRIFGTLARIVVAERRGDERTIHALVSDRRVAARIVRHSRALRLAGVVSLHVAPSLTLGELAVHGRLGVGFRITGKTRHDQVKAPQTVFLTQQRGRWVVVMDQPGQEW